MSKVLLASLLAGLVFSGIGCGGGDEEDSGANASKPASLLVTVSELPEGSTTSESPPELCGPLPDMQKNGGQTAVSKTFALGEVKVVEAVGVFGTSSQAQAAFDDLNKTKRLECIEGAMKLFGGASEVEMVEPEQPDVGDEGTVVRYVSFDDESEDEGGNESEPIGYSDVVALRVGRCTATLLIGIEKSDPPDEVSAETTETVADRLADACE